MRAAAYAGIARSTASASTGSPPSISKRHASVGPRQRDGRVSSARRTAPAVAHALGERVHELADAAGERHERARLWPVAARRRLSRGARARIPRTSDPYSRSIATSCGNAEAHREVARVAGRDPAEQRRDQSLGGFTAEPTAGELGDRLVSFGLVAARPDERLHRHAHLAGPREEPCPRERAELRRHAEYEPLGHRVQPTVPGDAVASIRLVRADERAPEAQLPRKRRGLRLARDPRVGASVEQEPADPLGDEVAAEARRALEYRDGDVAPELRARGRAPRAPPRGR